MSLRPPTTAVGSGAGRREMMRKKSYKSAVDVEGGRRRREDNMVEIRKSKREDNLNKKRREQLPSLLTTFAVSGFRSDGNQQQDEQGCAITDRANQLVKIWTMIEDIWSDCPEAQLESTTAYRKLLSRECDPPIDEVVRAGVVPRFVEFLARHDMPQLQFEAAWALTNVASGTSEHTLALINHGAVPLLVKILSSGSADVCEQAVWALGNIAGDSTSCRDFVLSHDPLLPLLSQFEKPKLSMRRTATWTLSNLCRGEPAVPFEQVKLVLPALQHLIHSTDEEILTSACRTVSYISNGTNDKIQAVLEAGVCPRLVDLLLHPSPAVYTPSLRTIGNIVTGDDEQTQVVIDNQVLYCFHQLLTQNYSKNIKRETCWAISNITAGNVGQIQAVIEAKIIGPVVHLLRHEEFEIKKEAAWAITNASTGAAHEHIRYLVEQGCINPLCDLLTSTDSRIVMVCLKGLENILRVGESDNELGKTNGGNIYAEMIDYCGGLDKIEALQNHDNKDIYDMSVYILETYWSKDEEDDVQR
ncbi:hypothetical protein C5167_014998 [Papaver somniferum]|uniref:Importin subunit alpha n=1 Tax=Papaver somniferum TaxID=3469 RepID=A0A4Y7J6P3_PAPSO|nr:importin subunit alpha-like [Papaver somniferum]RZC56136.1 hypothetical protein C5167_014998 [Papaver somniferum]